jgi:hypothetical protein
MDKSDKIYKRRPRQSPPKSSRLPPTEAMEFMEDILERYEQSRSPLKLKRKGRTPSIDDITSQLEYSRISPKRTRRDSVRASEVDNLSRKLGNININKKK